MPLTVAQVGGPVGVPDGFLGHSEVPVVVLTQSMTSMDCNESGDVRFTFQQILCLDTLAHSPGLPALVGQHAG